LGDAHSWDFGIENVAGFGIHELQSLGIILSSSTAGFLRKRDWLLHADCPMAVPLFLINIKNCSLFIVLMATFQKPQESLKR